MYFLMFCVLKKIPGPPQAAPGGGIGAPGVWQPVLSSGGVCVPVWGVVIEMKMRRVVSFAHFYSPFLYFNGPVRLDGIRMHNTW